MKYKIRFDGNVKTKKLSKCDGINVLSCFDGMSCGQIALNKLKVNVNKYFSSEIKKIAIDVTQHNYPKTIQLGDIRNINSRILPKIDLVIGGSPCQDFSRANSNKDGLSGDKSSLFYEFNRLLKEVKPTYFLLENVKMDKKNERVISNILGCEPVRINSSIVSPQLRDRLYWTNIQINNHLVDTNSMLNDYISGYSDREKARTLLSSCGRPLKTPVKIAHRYFNGGFTTVIFRDVDHYNAVKNHFYANFIGKSAKEIDLMVDNTCLDVYNGIRYMNKSEMEYCQTVPQGYCDILSRNECANVLGDGWTVDVISHILSNAF